VCVSSLPVASSVCCRMGGSLLFLWPVLQPFPTVQQAERTCCGERRPPGARHKAGYVPLFLSSCTLLLLLRADSTGLSLRRAGEPHSNGREETERRGGEEASRHTRREESDPPRSPLPSASCCQAPRALASQWSSAGGWSSRCIERDRAEADVLQHCRMRRTFCDGGCGRWEEMRSSHDERAGSRGQSSQPSHQRNTRGPVSGILTTESASVD
jgi:hypothetical protein